MYNRSAHAKRRQAVAIRIHASPPTAVEIKLCVSRIVMKRRVGGGIALGV